jgi:hypothetical protein
VYLNGSNAPPWMRGGATTDVVSQGYFSFPQLGVDGESHAGQGIAELAGTSAETG